MSRGLELAGGTLVVAVLLSACGPDWDALDPSLGGEGGAGGASCPPPEDGEECTVEQCVGGVPQRAPAQAGTPCAQRGGKVCDGSGACIECLTASECPGEDSECRTRMCEKGACVFLDQPSGAEASSQTPGDCKKAVCDGAGAVKSTADNADKPDDGKECTTDVCNAGQPVSTPIAVGSVCSQGGGKVCDESGACVACVTGSDCGVNRACVAYTCDAGLCSTDPNLPAGEPCGAGAKCDGGGVCVTCQPATKKSFTSLDPFLFVPNDSDLGATSTVLVGGLGAKIIDVDVTLDITGDTSGDLEVSLVSPSNTVINLTSGNGGLNNDVYSGTTFDDDTNAPRITRTTFANNVTVVSAIPERNLGLLNGEDPNGVWKLLVKDLGAGGAGALISGWSLAITAQASTTVLPQASFTNTNDVNIVNNGEVMSPIQVSGLGGLIYKATAKVNITHSSSGQLTITLVSPAGKAITLSKNNGAQNDDVFDGTLFDDAGPLLMGCAGAGCVTFSDGNAVPAAIPEGSLSSLIGDDPNGTWFLNVADNASGSGGEVTSWSLSLTPALCSLTP